MPDHPPSPPASTILWQLAIVFALVFANAFFVAAEFSLVSVRRTRIDQLAAEGSKSAAMVQRALREINRYIAATQVGISIVSLVLGGLGEQTLEPMLQTLLTSLQVPQRWLGMTRIGVATFFAYFIMTTMHVIIGELVPKSFALHKADIVALWLVRPLGWFARLVTPLVWMLNGIGNFLLRGIGIHAAEGHSQVHSPEELDLIFTQSHEGGELTATERDILHRVVKFSDLTAREVMVPRVEIQGIPLEMPRHELTALLHGQPHTRMPVYLGSLDDLVGIAHLKDLLRFEAALRAADGDAIGSKGDSPQGDSRHNGAAGTPLHGATGKAQSATGKAQSATGNAQSSAETVNLMSLVREAARVPETVTIDKILVEFKKRRQQMAIVIDEYGGTSGLITMGDLLDQVFGDVPDEFDQPEPQIAARADGRLQLPARILIDEINERYGTGFHADEVDTMAGLVLGVLGRPAVVGDEVEINGAHLRVEAVDRLRIITLSLQLPADNTTSTMPGTSDSNVTSPATPSPNPATATSVHSDSVDASSA